MSMVASASIMGTSGVTTAMFSPDVTGSWDRCVCGSVAGIVVYGTGIVWVP